MAKISVAIGATDEHAEGYYSPGRSHQSPNVRGQQEKVPEVADTPALSTVRRKRGHR